MKLDALNIKQSFLAAVSGGRDSIVLAELLHRGGYRFEIAHCNFHLRGDESNRDEQFVRDLAKRYEVPCHVAQFDTDAYASEKKISTEMAARELRYEWFEKVRQERGLDLIAVAHHRDDAIETFFINLLRGAGLSGLCGMKAENGHVVRPLLGVSRDEIDRFVADEHLEYVDDHTNATDLYLRNRIRHQLIPLLRELNPSFDSVMAQNLHNLSDANEIYQSAIAAILKDIVTHRSDGIDEIPVASIETLKPQDTLLFELLRPYGFNADTVSEILCGLHGESGRQYLSSTHKLVKDRETLQLTPLDNCDVKPVLTISDPMPRESIATLKTPKDTILCDAKLLKQPLTLRHWHDGDRFYPFGMKGSQLVSDYFSDHKFSLPEKQQAWLLCDADDKIVWVIGHRADGRFAVTGNTMEIIEIKAVSGNSQTPPPE
ncbi:MAG: tRNA lysidine(34) synthetase TilS [Bacteroidales bacterium]|nr:tRNA lysidine(34) synthetase TilS [Bacteroidales bacterium]